MTPLATVHGTKIRRHREEVGWSQAELAVKAGVGLATVQRAEKSTPQIGYGIARKIAIALGVEVSDIYEDETGADAPTTTRDIGSDVDEIKAMLRSLIEFHRTGDRRALA